MITGRFAVAIPLVIIAAVAFGAFLVQQNAAMRRDISAGRVVDS